VTVPDHSPQPESTGESELPPPTTARPPLLNRALTRLYRSLPALIAGVLIGALGAIVWQAIAADGRSDDFAPGPQPRNPDVVVTLSYELIAALIEAEVERNQPNLPLRNIQAGEKDGRLLLRGTVDVLRQDVGATVELEPHVEDGRLVTRVRSARFGIVPVPSNLQRLAEDPLNRELTAVIANLPATLTSVRVTDAGLVVSADVRIEELPFFEEK
jgi:hypothetical protein